MKMVFLAAVFDCTLMRFVLCLFVVELCVYLYVVIKLVF